jgi:DNA methyltransferase 1-associated protein 1
LIPLPTAPVIEAFDSLMSKLHVLLDMRKVAEKEEQELRVREAEAAAQAKGE